MQSQQEAAPRVANLLSWIVHVPAEAEDDAIPALVELLEEVARQAQDNVRGPAMAAAIEVNGTPAVSVLTFGRATFDALVTTLQLVGYTNRLLEEDPETGLDGYFARRW